MKLKFIHAYILSSILLFNLYESRYEVLFCNTFTKQTSSLCMCVLRAGRFLAVMWVWTCIRWMSRGCIRSCGAAGFSPSLLMLHTSWRKCLILSGSWYWSLSLAESQFTHSYYIREVHTLLATLKYTLKSRPVFHRFGTLVIHQVLHIGRMFI